MSRFLRGQPTAKAVSRCAEPAGLGHGLAGMRERASLYGGIVTAGDGPAGGYSVTAHLPLHTPVS